MNGSIPQSWSFENVDVAHEFNDHVRESLPWYDLATQAMTTLVANYLPEGGHVYDIGAGTGNVGRAIEDLLKIRNATMDNIESSKEMFNEFVGPGNLIVAQAQSYDFEPFDVGVLFLTLMFIPVADRWQMVCRMMDAMRTGGCLIILDKMENPGGSFGTALHRMTMAQKVRAGASAEQIVQKELSLAGVQRPITTMPGAMPWFRFGDFAGWLIEKVVPSPTFFTVEHDAVPDAVSRCDPSAAVFFD